MSSTMSLSIVSYLSFFMFHLGWGPWIQGDPIPITSDVAQGEEEEKRETNDNCNPGEVQVHMWEVEAVEVKEQDWGI